MRLLRLCLARVGGWLLHLSGAADPRKAAADCQAALRFAEVQKDSAIAQLKYFRAQVMQIRVSQAREDRMGWEVMAYIPEGVLKRIRAQGSEGERNFVRRIAEELVNLAVRGVNHVDSQGKVCALFFAPIDVRNPKAPEYVEALFDKDGKFKHSEKAWKKPESEEVRVKRAAGLPSYQKSDDKFGV